MPQKTDREYRAFEVRADEERKAVKGYATTFNQPYVLYEDEEYQVREIIDENAFDECDLSDVIMQYNHEGRVFARNTNGTLNLTIDKPNGLLIDADLGGTELGGQVYEEIKGGYTDKMSMGFKVDRSADVWTREQIDGKVIETRQINRITKLYDVSAVSIPANGNTSIEAVSVRALVDGVIDEIRAERLEAERIALKRKRAEIRARLMED
ncbi:MAG: HK97 family phage prohead protease [Ruminococcus sp.]|nr:HK97 family phage prohead protease [Ruminococcus sp.]